MKMVNKIILLILFCMLGFLCSQWAKSVSNKIHEPVKIECEGDICPVPEEYKDK